jgi:hypothetical protein
MDIAQLLGGVAQPLDLPKFGGPYSAPLTQGQMDSLQGFNRLFNGQPLLQTNDLRKAIDFAISGGPVYHPNFGKTLTEQVEPFRLPSAATEAAKIGVGNGFMSGFLPTGTDTSGVLGEINKYLNSNVSKMPGYQVDEFVSPFRGTMNRDLGPGSDIRSSLGTALKAPRFDTSQLFSALDNEMRGELDNVVANEREQASGLGLNAGSGNRSAQVTRAAGDVLNKFKLGKAQIEKDAFESAEGRRIGALGVGNDTTRTNQSGVGMQLGAAETGANLSQIPFIQALTERNSLMPLLNLKSDITRLPFNEQLAVATGIYEPAANRRMNSTALLGQLEEQPFNRFFNVAESGANRAMAMLPQLFNLEQKPYDRMMQQFSLNEIARQVADNDINRRWSEFARTQGGGLDQIIKILSTIRPNEVGVGPSVIGQIGGLIEGIGSFFGGG